MDSFNSIVSQDDLRIYASLNEQQRAAVLHDQTPVLVIAGAGSGKTRIITSRIAYLLLHKKVPASSIVALTFTNKAAHQMKDRISQLIGADRQLPFVGTFHSYCVLLLRKYGSRLNLLSFSIIDDDDQKKMIADILHRHGLHKQYTPKTVLSSISQMKNHLLDPATQARSYLTHPVVYDVYQAYEREKKASNCLDFDDLLHWVVKLFKSDEEFKVLFQRQVRHVLVDEYQDTNVIQHALLVEMCKKENAVVAETICVVGDEDQSIYSWRGATIANILHFAADFPQAHTIKVEQNYRSVEPILTLANKLIEHNTQRNRKRLWSERKGSDRIRILVSATQYQEAELVVQMIKDARQKNPEYTCAILYRTHTQSRSIEEAFLKQAVPYKIVGGIQFYERKEIKDLLAYLRLVVNPYDRIAFMRVLNVPTRGLGPKVEEQVRDCWQNEPFISFRDVIDHLISTEQVAGKKRDELTAFVSIFRGLTLDQKPSDILEAVIERSRYLSYLLHEYEPAEAQERTATVTELLNAMRYLEKNKIETLEEFLQEIMLMQELVALQAQDADLANCVLLMTIHAAKGLEFDCVALVGLEEGIFPSSRAQYDEAALEEERRLLYVGITRAKEWLLMSYAKSRYLYGTVSDQRKSRFFDDIARELIPVEDASFWRPFRFVAYFADWFGIKKAEAPIPVSSFRESSFSYKPAARTPRSVGIEWQQNSRVKHPVFGVGIVQAVETRPHDMVYVTVKFSLGVKKLLSKFLEKID